MVGSAIHADPLGLLVAFGAGMLSFVSPCVLPLVPAYLSMVSGLSAAELQALSPAPAPAPDRQPVGVGGVARGTPDAPDMGDPEAPAPEALRAERARLLRGILAFIAGFTVIFTI